MPMAAPAEPLVKIEGEEITIAPSARARTVCLDWKRSSSRGVMRVNVKVSGRNVRGEYSYHGDTLDMESFRQRATFTQAGRRTNLGAKEETIHAEVGAEAVGRAGRPAAGGAHPEKTLAQPVEETIMNAEEQAAALELLRDPRLLERVLSTTSTNAAWWARRRTSALVIWRRCRACWKNRWPS